MMKWKKITPREFVVSNWSGGKTTQIAIDPPQADYADRNFHFRLSSAIVEQENSEFTVLPDYDRIIAPIRGELSLYYNGSARPVVLHELECAAFDGAWNTRSRGRVVDYNLMTRKGVCSGSTFALMVGVGQTASLSAGGRDRGVMLIWCAAGTAGISVSGETALLSPRDAARLDWDAGSAPEEIILRGAGEEPVRIMVARVSFLSSV